MQLNFYYDNIVGNQFMNNFIPYKTIKSYIKNPNNDFRSMTPARINSIIPTFMNNFSSIDINYMPAASIPYQSKMFNNGKNIFSYEPWHFDSSPDSYKFDFNHSFLKNFPNNADILVFYPTEGFHFNKRHYLFDILHKQFPRSNIRFVFGNLKTPNWTKNTPWLIYKSFDYWWHDAAQMTKNNAVLDLDKDKLVTKSFSFYNRRMNMHRAIVYKDLLDSNLLQDADYTFHGRCNLSISNVIRVHLDDIKTSPENSEFTKIIESLEFLQFAENNMQKESSESQNLELYEKDVFYQTSYLDLITETLVDDNEDNLFITEKTYRSIVSGNIFLIIGQPGVLEYLKSHGIKTFDDIFDESYDSKLHWYERWKIIKNNLIKWINLGPHTQEQYYKDNFDKIQHNRSVILNRDFTNDVINIFK